jgi:hypothetical protein
MSMYEQGEVLDYPEVYFVGHVRPVPARPIERVLD